jgi:hypothetical protein
MDRLKAASPRHETKTPHKRAALVRRFVQKTLPGPFEFAVMKSVAHAAPNLNITVVRSLAAPETQKPRPWGGTSDGALAGFHLQKGGALLRKRQAKR